LADCWLSEASTFPVEKRPRRIDEGKGDALIDHLWRGPEDDSQDKSLIPVRRGRATSAGKRCYGGSSGPFLLLLIER